jgi:aldose 1-epimerase
MRPDDARPDRTPSGQQYAIAVDDSAAHVAQVGATLRSCTLDGIEVLDGFGVAERATDGRGQVLAPWPNRLTDGNYRYGGHRCQAPINELDRHTAIHGLVRWVDWSPVAHEPTSVTLACAVRPQPAYEWQLDLAVTYALDRTGLQVTLRASNAGTERAPFGAGFHPYLMLGTPSVDALELTVPATEALDPSGPGGAPQLAPATGTPLDFFAPRAIGSTRLDTCYGGLVRGDDRRAVARLADPGRGRSVRLWVDEAYRYLMVYTGDAVGRPERRRRAVAVEPMTCPPDAFRTGTDLVELDPGESWVGSWGLQAESPRSS